MGLLGCLLLVMSPLVLRNLLERWAVGRVLFHGRWRLWGEIQPVSDLWSRQDAMSVCSQPLPIACLTWCSRNNSWS